MASHVSKISDSTLHISRSEPPHFSSANIPLSTVNTIRNHPSASHAVQPANAVSIPFIVTSTFTNDDPDTTQFHHLFPNCFPEIDSDLGYGASFIVQKAFLGDLQARDTRKTAVALKRIRPSGPRGLESFHSVIKDLLCLTHLPLRKCPNVVSLLGLGWEKSPSEGDYRLWPYLILEYSSIGSLADLQSGYEDLSLRHKETLALDVAHGLCSVHYSNIIHGDVKSENVLVFPNQQNGYVAKLSDFGFSTLDVDFPVNGGRKINIDDVRETARISTGTPPWTAPEFGKVMKWELAFKTDIYSWGLLVWRLFLNGQSPFTVFKGQFDSSATSVSVLPEDIQSWKEKNLVLPVATLFSQTIQHPTSGELENAFRHSLAIEPEDRDLRRAFLPWKFGDQYVIGLNTLQSYNHQLRQQFLRDLDELGKLSSPLEDGDALFCPTNLASMTVAEYHIVTNDLGLAYNHMVRAAKRDYPHALALVAQLEPYHGSFDRLVDNSDHPADLTIKISNMKPPTRAIKWLYRACCMGSISALQQLKIYDTESYAAALKVSRSIAMGGIDLDLLTGLDLRHTKEKGQITAASELEETVLFLSFPPDSLQHWIVSGPVVGRDISPLHVASAKGLIEPIGILLEGGACINSQDCPERCTPLLLACISGSLNAVQKLLKKGADATVGNKKNETPLHWLSSFDQGNVPVVAKLLFQKGSQLSALADGGALGVEGNSDCLAMARGTPLHRAIGRRNIVAVRSLLDLGADPLLVDQHGVTPFALATRLHLTAIMELLHSRIRPYKPNQDHGPNLRLFNFAINSADPLVLFMIHGDRWLDNAEKTLLLLLKFGESLYGYGGEDNFINNAIFVGNCRMAKVLLDNGATKHMEKMDIEFGGESALMCAVSNGHRHIFTELLKHGASVHTQLLPASLRQPGARIELEVRPDRSTFIHFCAEMGSDTFFVDEFVRQGLPINQPDAEWNTALFLALRSGHLHVASRLIHHGAKLGEVRDGLTLLGQLAEQGFGVPKERYQWILERSQETGTSGFLTSPRYRQSIFHHIAQDKRTVRQPVWARDLIAFFIERVSDIRILDLQDVMLNSALHLAVQSHNIEAANALVEAGARLDLLNLDGKSPLNIAREDDGLKAKELIRILELHGAGVKTASETGAQSSESAMALWKELGFQKQLREWLDTALIPILEELRQTLLTLFRSEGFLLQENPWKSATKAVFDILDINRAILDREERIRQFEYVVGEMLHGFVDSVTVSLTAGRETMIVKLVKPLDARPKFPSNLLNEEITSMALSPEVGQITFHHSFPNNPSSRIGMPHRSNPPAESSLAESLSKPPKESGRSLGNWIRLRRLDHGRFIIEDSRVREGFLGALTEPDAKDSENRFVFRKDTGVMLCGDDNDFTRKIIVDQLLENEPVVEIIDTTQEGQIHRSTSIAGLTTLTAAFEARNRSGPLAKPRWRTSSQSRSTAGPKVTVPTPSQEQLLPQLSALPKVSQRIDLSDKEKERLRKLLLEDKEHVITQGDELGLLLFNYPIPKGVWIFVSIMEGNFGIAFPCRGDDKGNPVKLSTETERVANEFTMTLDF